MKKLFTKLFCLCIVFGVFHSANANNIDRTNVVCPTISDANYPGDIVISDDALDFTTLTDELSPSNLVLNYGFTEAETMPTYPDPDNCNNLAQTYEDIVINIDGVSFKVLRNWTVIDWFTGDINEQYQILRNLVDADDQQYCVGTVTVPVGPWVCEINGVDPESFLASGFDYDNITMTPDPSTIFGIGIHNITVEATVGSENFICYSTLIVEDNTPPIPIVFVDLQLALDENCTATITPEFIDAGSHDGDCGDITMSVEPSTFTADDAGSDITVTLTVVDEAGNFNIAWTTIEILPCTSGPIFQCLQVVTIADLNESGIQLFPEDFLTSSSTDSGDLSLTIVDSNGNVFNDGFIPQGSGGSFAYTVRDNQTGLSCSGVIQAPLIFDPCTILACSTNIFTTLSEDGTVTLFPEDLALNVENCTGLTLEIYDENSNLLASGASVTIDQTGTYMYQVINAEDNLCWATLEVGEYVPCPSSLACNNNISVSMYVPSGSATAIATITSDMLLEGNTSGCDISNYAIQIEDTGVVGFFFEGVGSVEVNQPGLYTYTITDPETNNSCFGMLEISNFTSCPELSDITFPEDLELSIVGLTVANVFEQLAPESLVNNYGYTAEETEPIWDQSPLCGNLITVYSDELFGFDDDSFTLIRTWTALDWLTGNITEVSQVLTNSINLGLICDFLPNSTDFGDCDSGHTDTDDVEWPDDLSIADYRILPNDLIAFSQVDLNDSQPIIVNNASIYTLDYVDILAQLEVNQITVNRVWTIAANNVDVATYTQTIVVDITGFSSLVAVNTMTARPVEGVALTSMDMTNDVGVAFPSDLDNLDPILIDDYRNGVTIRDIVLTQHHILGLRDLNDLQILAADINGNNSVTAIDLVQQNNVILEMEPGTLSDWFFVDAPENENTINPSKEFIAIKPGDVDDDADLGSPFIFQSGKLFLEDALINNGESYQSKIQYNGEDLIFGAEVHVYYDENLISIESLEANVENAILTYNIDIPGEIHFTLQNSEANGFSFSAENHINIAYSANSNGLLSQAIDNTQSRNSYVVGLDYQLFSLGLEFVDEISTSTKDIPNHADIFKLYPNPATDYITFDFINETPGNFKIDIYNINGQLVAEHISETNIDVSALHSGMHFYRLTQNGQTYSGRFSIIK